MIDPDRSRGCLVHLTTTPLYIFLMSEWCGYTTLGSRPIVITNSDSDPDFSSRVKPRKWEDFVLLHLNYELLRVFVCPNRKTLKRRTTCTQPNRKPHDDRQTHEDIGLVTVHGLFFWTLQAAWSIGSVYETDGQYQIYYLPTMQSMIISEKFLNWNYLDFWPT